MKETRKNNYTSKKIVLTIVVTLWLPLLIMPVYVRLHTQTNIENINEDKGYPSFDKEEDKANNSIKDKTISEKRVTDTRELGDKFEYEKWAITQMDGSKNELYNCIPTSIRMYKNFYGRDFDFESFKKDNVFKNGNLLESIDKELKKESNGSASYTAIGDIPEDSLLGNNIFILATIAPIGENKVTSDLQNNPLHVSVGYYENKTGLFCIYDPLSIEKEINKYNIAEVEDYLISIWERKI